MKLPVHAAGASLLLFVFAGPGEEEIDFAPALESSLSKRFSTEGEVALDDLQILMNGQEMDPAMMGLDSDLGMSFGYVVACRDEYRAVADGRPTKLLRTYEEFAGWYVDPEGEEQRESNDEVLDAAILFAWDAEEESYALSFEEGDLDDEDLEGLAEDLDLRALLPDGPVEEGASWDVAGPDLLGVLLAGVDVPGVLAEAEADDEVPEVVHAFLDDLVEDAGGRCSFAGHEEVDGRTLAVLRLESTIDSSIDIDPSLLGDSEGMGLADARFEVSVELDIEGTCLWDVAGGHFVRFDLEAFGSVALDAAATAPDAGLDFEGTGEFAIDVQHQASASKE